MTTYALADEEVHREMMKTILNEFTKQGFTNVRASVKKMIPPEKMWRLYA